MSSALKPALPPAGGQSTPAVPSPTKNVPPHTPGMSHNPPTSYTQSVSHVPQNLGMPIMTANILPNMSPQNPGSVVGGVGHPTMMSQVPPVGMTQASHNMMGPSKSVGLPMGRPNMLPYHPNSGSTMMREEEGTTLPASQNAAQLMAAHRAQEQVGQNYSKPQSNGTAPVPVPAPVPVLIVQPDITMKTPTVPTLVEVVKPEPPVVLPVQNHIPESAKQPPEIVPQPLEKPAISAVPITVSPGPVVEPVAKVITPPIVVTEPAAEVLHPVTPITPTKAAVPKEIVVNKAPSTLKLATTSPRTTNRKRETKPVSKPSSSSSSSSSDRHSESPKINKSSPGHARNKSPGTPAKVKGGRTSEDERKSKRTRTRTQPYQSPLPELALITKLSTAPPSKAIDEKLIVFYKNEFLAVRNAEGGFYVCQAVQNVYKSSPRIRIRWLSQDKIDKTYIPDFYDFTDFDCILTNINMERIEKGKYNLPKEEEERTENILKRALAVESGDAAPSLTEEHPDGLDLSLFRDESQLKKKRKGTKRKSSEPLSGDSSDSSRMKKTPEKSKVRKTMKPSRNAKNSSVSDKTNYGTENGKKKKKTKSSNGRAERAKRRGGGELSSLPDTKSSPVVDQKKARVLAKVALKTATVTKNAKKPSVRTTTTSKSASSSSSSAYAASSSSRAAAAAQKSTTRSQGAGTGASSSSSSSSNTRRGKKANKK